MQIALRDALVGADQHLLLCHATKYVNLDKGRVFILLTKGLSRLMAFVIILKKKEFLKAVLKICYVFVVL